MTAEYERWISVREASQKSGLSDSQIRVLIKNDHLKWTRPTPRTTRVAESSLRELLGRTSNGE